MASVESIVSTEDTVSGSPRIAETRVRVLDVVESYQEQGWRIEKIAEQFRIGVDDVLDALRWYHDNADATRTALRVNRADDGAAPS